MAENSQDKKVSVTRVAKQRSPEQLRRIGRALIALARAQLEAEATAEHGAQGEASPSPGKRSA